MDRNNNNNITCDIVLLSYESPGLLAECVQSVLDHTRVRSRLIIVDNASKDPEVARYLNDVKGNEIVRIETIFNEENAGFSAGINIGLRLANAPFACILNNDCFVSEGWLEEMISIAEKRPNIGLVNPQSSNFGSYPDSGVSINKHSQSLRDKKGKYVELGHAIGFAMLIKKEVIDEIGFLDEKYQGFCYEDTDYSVRANRSGYISVMAEASYVFHMEQASRKHSIKKEEVYKRNRQIFEKLWGKLLRVFFCDNTHKDEKDFMKTYGKLKGIAGQRAIVELWIRDGDVKPADPEFFDERDMIRHADVGVKIVPSRWVSWLMLWRILTKKKKYDAIIIGKGSVLILISMLRFLHKAESFYIEGEKVVSFRGSKTFDIDQPEALANYLRKRVNR